MATSFIWNFGTASGDFSDANNWFAVTSGNVGSNGTAPNGASVEAEMFTVAGTPLSLTISTAVTLSILDILTNGGPTASLAITGPNASLTVANVNLETPIGVRLPPSFPTGTGANVLFGAVPSATIDVSQGGAFSLGDNFGPPLTVDFLDGKGNEFVETSSISLDGTVAGFSGTDALDFPLVPFDLGLGVTASEQYDPATHNLSVFGPHSIGSPQAASYVLKLDASFAGGPDSFVAVDDGHGHTGVHLASAACFVAGTRIATERGMQAVETLRAGDRVRTVLDGRLRPIIWLGHRQVDCRHHPNPTQVWPIRILAGVFGSGRPFRDLLLSPDHSVFIDGALIPVRYLVNGRTIAQEACDVVAYWHVELAEHDVLDAEGLPAESYLDTGNRSAFANGGAVMDLHPDFAWRTWEAKASAPLVLCGPKLAAAKRWLLMRAHMLGHHTTEDPGLRVVADDKVVQAERHGRVWRVALPEATAHVRLASRVWSPAHMRPDTNDTRLLGVAVSRIWLDGLAVALDGAQLSHGWHACEHAWRWTDGDALLAVDGVHALSFELALSGCYWREEERAEACLA